MAYTKNFKKRPRKMRRGRKPLNKGQVKAINSIVSRSLTKTREMKYHSTRFDEDPVPLQTGNRFCLHTGSVANMFDITQGVGPSQRVGNEATILGFEWRGHIKVNGATTYQQQREATVRLCWGFVRGETTMDMTDLAFIGGSPVDLPTDYSAIYCDLNWNKFRPIHEKVFKLAPASHFKDNDNNLVQQVGTVPDCKILKYSRSFGKNGLKIQFPSSLEDYANKNNLVLLAITRNANDDVTVSTLNMEVCGVCNVRYQDA